MVLNIPSDASSQAIKDPTSLERIQITVGGKDLKLEKMEFRRETFLSYFSRRFGN